VVVDIKEGLVLRVDADEDGVEVRVIWKKKKKKIHMLEVVAQGDVRVKNRALVVPKVHVVAKVLVVAVVLVVVRFNNIKIYMII
jgi:hypothetical protein